MTNRVEISKTDILKHINTVYSFKTLGNILNIHHQTARKLIKLYNIDVSHFHTRFCYINKTFNCLTINDIIRKQYKTRNRFQAKCTCICGKICNKRLNHVLSGRTIACSVYCTNKYKNRQFSTGKNNPAFKGYEDISLSHFNRIKKGAINRNIKFDLNIEFLWDLYIKQNKICALSKQEISFGSFHTQETTASLDRIDNTQGYILGNVQWLHKDVNKLKGEFNQTYFINLCKLIGKNYE